MSALMKAARHGHRKRAQPSCFDVGHYHRQRGKHELDLPSDKIRHHGSAALVGNVRQIDAGERHEHLTA